MSVIDAKIPAGPLKDKWSAHKGSYWCCQPGKQKRNWMSSL